MRVVGCQSTSNIEHNVVSDSVAMVGWGSVQTVSTQVWVERVRCGGGWGLEVFVLQTRLGYVVTAERMVGPVVFVISDLAKYITGCIINASGGFLI